MKLILIITITLSVGFTRFALADDIVRNHAGKQHAAQPSAKTNTPRAQAGNGVHPSTVSAGRNRFGFQPNLRTRQKYLALEQPIDRGSLALNVQSTPRTFRPTGMVNQPGRSRDVDSVGSNVRTGGTTHDQVDTSNRRSYFDALKRCHHERHDRNWWHRHCQTIVFVNTGFYYLDAGYWYPAYGYSPQYDYYDYDGPIYTYADLLPDQVIANVQGALREAGYYVGSITGALNPATRAAISNFQRDYGLIITGAIDEPTVQTLGLN